MFESRQLTIPGHKFITSFYDQRSISAKRVDQFKRNLASRYIVIFVMNDRKNQTINDEINKIIKSNYTPDYRDNVGLSVIF